MEVLMKGIMISAAVVAAAVAVAVEWWKPQYELGLAALQEPIQHYVRERHVQHDVRHVFQHADEALGKRNVDSCSSTEELIVSRARSTV
ncbi:hypothetical protein MSG28_014566 [Choristoneura fumiferana]|uniref:Uncharacterized protein n=1 Tax=Choristoneura fumiferana TaxID=7141 RepID=A0ACC0JRU5_CHOFU|nr:hypothetical protein MSG28_014566 [Choristoneura fumiferana]